MQIDDLQIRPQAGPQTDTTAQSGRLSSMKMNSEDKEPHQNDTRHHDDLRQTMKRTNIHQYQYAQHDNYNESANDGVRVKFGSTPPPAHPLQSGDKGSSWRSKQSETGSKMSLMISRILPKLDSSDKDTDTKLGKLLTIIDPFIVLFIFVNSLMIGIGTLDEIDNNDTARKAFEMSDNIFLIIFTVEVLLSTIHFLRLDKLNFDPTSSRTWLPSIPPLTRQERKVRPMTQAWLIFDLVVVTFSWIFRKGSIVRAFRIFRAMRLISKVKSLKNLTRALLHVCPKMGALVFITVVLLIVASTMCTLLFKDAYENGYTSFNYFGRIDLSLLTLFQMMTFDNWHEPVRELMVAYPWAWIIFVFWVFVSGFVIMNLIIAIVCEALVNVDQMGKKALMGQAISDEFSIRDLSSSPDVSDEGKFDLRLSQLENAIQQLLDEEFYILEELEKLKEKQS